MAELDPRLQSDCREIARLGLCRLLLMLDANYPWFILVPDRDGLTEIHQLQVRDRHRLIDESARLSGAMSRAFEPDKLNVAALGNLVAQLHLHHIARYRDDPAWPAPVWGRVPPRPYQDRERIARVERLRACLGGDVDWIRA